jgi:uncharacterized repeat protein (TIGR01451 family)
VFYLDPGDAPTFNLSVKLGADDFIYHVFVNDTDNLVLPPGTNYLNTWNLPLQEIVLSKGWRPGLNEIVIATYSPTGGAGIWVQPTGAPLCAGKLSVTKTASQNGPDAVRYAIALANTGAVDVTGVSVSDALPPGLSNGAWSCAGSGCPSPGSGSMALFAPSGITLHPNESQVYTITASVDAGTSGTLTNTAQAFAANMGAFCWDGSAASMPPCKASASLSLVPFSASAVPTLDRRAYGLMGLGVLAMAAVAARRTRVR